MSSFTNALILDVNADGKTFLVHEEFEYLVGAMSSCRKITVQKGFKTDLASIPSIARIVIPVHGKWTEAAVLHDKMYAYPYYRLCVEQAVLSQKINPTAPNPLDQSIVVSRLNRKECDDIFLEAMGVLGVSKWRKYAIYSGVRVGGWLAWRNHRKNDK